MGTVKDTKRPDDYRIFVQPDTEKKLPEGSRGTAIEIITFAPDKPMPHVFRAIAKTGFGLRFLANRLKDHLDKDPPESWDINTLGSRVQSFLRQRDLFE